MAKSKKAKTAQKKVIDFKKPKLKVGRKLKKLNETLPQVKVGKVLIKDQFASKKINKDFIKNEISEQTEDSIDEIELPTSKLLELSKNILSTIKRCYGSTKSTDKKDFLVSVRHLIETHHYKLVLVNEMDIIEGVCPLMVDVNYEVRLEVPKLLKSVIKRSIVGHSRDSEEKLMTKNWTHSNCPIIVASICRALANPNFCLDSLLNIDVINELCPYLIVSASKKLLEGLLMLCWKQNSTISNGTKLSINSNNSKSPLIKNLSSNNSFGTSYSTMNLTSQNLRLSTKKSRLEVIKRLTSFFNVVIGNVHSLEYLAHEDNILDDPQQCCDVLLNDMFNILVNNFVECCYNNSSSTTTKSNKNISINKSNQIVFDELSYELVTCTLTCMQTSLKLVACLVEEGAKINDMTTDKHSQQLTQHYPILAFRRLKKMKQNKEREKDVSQILNSKLNKIIQYLKNQGNSNHDNSDGDYDS